MGSLLSMVYVWWVGPSKMVSDTFAEDGDLGPEADVKDATTGLTLRHRTAMVRTWDLVKPDMKTHGINFFIEMFRQEPILQTRFKGFVGKSPDELRSSRRLAAHGSTVMLAINNFVENLDDLDTLVELLKTTGANHRQREIPKRDFDLLAPILVDFLRTSLGKAWTPIADEAWTQALKVINSVIFSAYDRPAQS